MFWSDPEEQWARFAWHSIQQTRTLAMQKRVEHRMELSLGADGSLKVLRTREAPRRAGPDLK